MNLHSPPPKRIMRSNGPSINAVREHQGYQPYTSPRFSQPVNAPRMAPPTNVPNEIRTEMEVDNTSRFTDPGYTSALRAWGRFRFVRAGWFTSTEAIAYIE